MKIKVGDLAKIYDLSNQCLHYYENKKLITSERDIINNYRYYNSDDLSKLGTIKKYRNAKINIETITQIMKDTNNIENVQDIYVQQIEEIKQEIIHNYNVINVLTELNNKINLCINNSIILEDLSFYRVDAGETQIIFQNKKNKEFFQSWFKNILFTNSSYKLFLDHTNVKYLHYGMACDEKYHNYIEIDNRVIKNQGKYLIYYFVDLSNNSDVNQQIATLLNYASSNNIKLTDECYLEIIQSITGKNKPIRYSRLLFKTTC